MESNFQKIKEFDTKEIKNNLNDSQNDNNINSKENIELEEIKNELDNKNKEILTLQNDLNFYKEKNAELNLELDKIKSLIINDDIKENEINNLRKEINYKDNQIQIMNIMKPYVILLLIMINTKKLYLQNYSEID